ncbi:hypothetical protein [Nocardioides sp. TF02-7]|uniref:hypothetical protein n=1 Tax=Nocardioides sp. TF02-7 TaxID=2917724 RepID=UPI001F061D3B|nr:hypothetical protein [Nocardioides sp. TF02-7]UMG91070.1 hypothetical protein MF408_12725 [Nocardioides sp. TF02-7]
MSSATPARGGKHRMDPPGTVDPRALAVPDARAAGRDVLEALVTPEPARPEEPAEAAPDPGTDAERRTPPTPPAPPTPRPTPSYGAAAAVAHAERQEATSRSTNMVFEPRRWMHRTVTAVFLVGVAATAGAAYVAYRDRTTLALGLAVLAGVLTLVVWAVRASTPVTELAVIRGQLEVIRAGRFEIIDLASPFTPILVEGTPGRRGWRVLIERPEQPLLVLDRSLVDPQAFTAVLHRVRPDLRPDAVAG